MAVDFGNAATVTFDSGMSGNASQVVQIGGLNRSVAVEDITPLSQANATYKKKKFSRRYEHEAIEFEFFFDSEASNAFMALGETGNTVTITYPGGESLAGDGALIGHSLPTLVGDEVMRATVQFQFEGGTGSGKPVFS